MPRYEFNLYESRSHVQRAELHPRDVRSESTWTRRDLGGGTFSLLLPRSSRYTVELFTGHPLLQIIRDGREEFSAIVDDPAIDKLSKQWQITGRDNTAFWLHQRIVGEDTDDPRTGAAETLAKGYVNDYAGAAALAVRRHQSYLQGLTWIVDAVSASPLGSEATQPASRVYLDALCEEICRRADILHEVVVQLGQGYIYQTRLPVNRTGASGFTPFGVDWSNVDALEFSTNTDELANVLYVAGEDPTSHNKVITQVSDEASVSTHYRREGVVDARYAHTEAQRQSVGELELAERARRVLAVKAQPARARGRAVYREDWDVGDDVTFDEPLLQQEPVDVRIVAATVTLSAEQGEVVTFELGAYKMSSQLRRISDAIAKLQASANA